MLLDLIRRRKSVRRYIDKAISKEDISKCLEAARQAPSACNGQPWKFIVVDEPALKNTLCDKAFSGAYSTNKFTKSAPVIIVVVSGKEKFLTAIGGFLRDTRYYLVDLGIACEHLVLEATELGIGSCWIGWFDERAVKKVLGVPRNKKIDVIISLGYAGDTGPRLKARKPLAEITSFNKYE